MATKKKPKVISTTNHKDGTVSVKFDFSGGQSSKSPKKSNRKRATKKVTKVKDGWFTGLLYGAIAIVVIMAIVEFVSPRSMFGVFLPKQEVHFSLIHISDEAAKAMAETKATNDRLVEELHAREALIWASMQKPKSGDNDSSDFGRGTNKVGRKTERPESGSGSQYIWGEPNGDWKIIGEAPSRYGSSPVYKIPSEPTH